MKKILFLIISGRLLFSFTNVVSQGPGEHKKADTTTLFPEEKHFANIRQLTFGGDNAEAYYSFDSRKLVFQMTNPDFNAPCDQIFISSINGFNPKMVSTGAGRTTCSYFLPG